MKVAVYIVASVLVVALVAITIRDIRARDPGRVSWLAAWVNPSPPYWVPLAGILVCYLLTIFVVGF